MSLKFAGNWKKHYLTHSDQKPHQCPHCEKSFVRADKMRKHIQAKHGQAMNTAAPQHQFNMAVKHEDGFY